MLRDFGKIHYVHELLRKIFPAHCSLFFNRTGLCTGWLDRLTSSIRCKKCNQCDGCDSVEFEDLGKEVAKLNLQNEAIKVIALFSV